MTLEHLHEEIENLYNSCEDPTKIKVKLALQPSYPMLGSIQNFCVEHGKDGEPETVYIACSNNENYGCPAGVWDDSDIWYDGDGELEVR